MVLVADGDGVLKGQVHFLFSIVVVPVVVIDKWIRADPAGARLVPSWEKRDRFVIPAAENDPVPFFGSFSRSIFFWSWSCSLSSATTVLIVFVCGVCSYHMRVVGG